MLTTFRNPNAYITLYATQDPQAKQIGIHKDFAIYYSPVLHKTFTGAFIESDTQEYRLEITEFALDLLMHWIYHQGVETPDKYGAKELITLTEGWILGEELLMLAFQNHCLARMSEIQKENKQKLTAADYNTIWDKTSEGNRLRMYLVNYVAALPGASATSGASENSGEYQLNDPPKDMLVAMFVRARKYASIATKQLTPSAMLPGSHMKKYEVPERSSGAKDLKKETKSTLL
jgi:hypothetical protein